jgi:hypothetical protein
MKKAFTLSENRWPRLYTKLGTVLCVAAGHMWLSFCVPI